MEIRNQVVTKKVGQMGLDKKILVVEDNMLLSLVYENYIEKMGFELLDIFADGESAIEAAKNLKPDLILMDIILKGQIDGIDAMKKIREYSNVPVIYITGNSDSQHIQRAYETGYADYLIKPISLEELKKSINKVFIN